MSATEPRAIYVIAREIRKDWIKPYFGAVPYIEAMLSIDSIHDKYIAEQASDVVNGFLSNCAQWKGDTARRVKNELKTLVKQARGAHQWQ